MYQLSLCREGEHWYQQRESPHVQVLHDASKSGRVSWGFQCCQYGSRWEVSPFERSRHTYLSRCAVSAVPFLFWEYVQVFLLLLLRVHVVVVLLHNLVFSIIAVGVWAAWTSRCRLTARSGSTVSRTFCCELTTLFSEGGPSIQSCI